MAGRSREFESLTYSNGTAMPTATTSVGRMQWPISASCEQTTPTIPTNVSSGVSFPEALWNLRAIDVVLQGLVIMTIALGIAIVLHEKKEGKN